MTLRRFGPIAVVVLAGLSAEASLWRAAHAQQARPSVPTSGRLLKPVPVPGQEPPPVLTPDVPFPGSLRAEEVLANVKAVVKNANLGEGLESPALIKGQFQLRRILRVRSDLFPGGYLVVEVTDLQGGSLAALAMTPLGAFIMMEDRRSGGVAPLELTVADAKVRARTGRPALSTGYVYFHNPIEGGVSLCRPLVDVRTDEGTIYLNSRGEAFADEAQPAGRTAAKDRSERVALANGRRLVPMGKW